MREFRYSALTGSGQTISGIRQASNKDVLAADLLEQGLVLLKSKSTMGGIFSGSRRINAKELRDVTQHMATCLGAGVTAVSALDDFQRQTPGVFGEILADIRNDINSGTQLDEAFSRHPEVFSSVYLALVASGQNSGALDEVFNELVSYLEWNENLRSQTSQALIYPTILVVGILGLFLLMMLFVIPRFQAIFDGIDMELPTITIKVMAMGDFMGHWWWLIFSVIAAATAGFKAMVRTEKGEFWRDKMLLKTPVVSSFLLKIALSRFSKTFSMIFGSGVSLLRALDLMQGVVGNRVMAMEIARIRSRVSAGETLTASVADADIFPPLVQRLVSVGEKTGSLDTSLRRASDYLDKEIPRDLKKAFTIFEAVIIAVLGVMVCVAALSLLMPIMSIRGDM